MQFVPLRMNVALAMQGVRSYVPLLCVSFFHSIGLRKQCALLFGTHTCANLGCWPYADTEKGGWWAVIYGHTAIVAFLWVK